MNQDTRHDNIDKEELNKFEQLADSWWDTEGEYRMLHRMNPLRANYIDRGSPVAGKKVLDVGCGGGLLCEALAARGAQMTGIDMGKKALAVAKQHLTGSGLAVAYRHISSNQLAVEEPGQYDIVCCLEMLEHVTDPAAVVADCQKLLVPGGSAYFSTINRTPLSWAVAILGAEYMLGYLAKGTHNYEKLIRPSELAQWLRSVGLSLQEMQSIHYNPLNKSFSLAKNLIVNYIVYAVKPDASAV